MNSAGKPWRPSQIEPRRFCNLCDKELGDTAVFCCGNDNGVIVAMRLCRKCYDDAVDESRDGQIHVKESK